MLTSGGLRGVVTCSTTQCGGMWAYVFGRRQDTVFLQRQALLTSFGITRDYTDGWGAYERHVAAEQHTVGKV
jgi:insertion element IS1 protein InsB